MLNRHVHNLTALLARQRPAVGLLAAVLLLSAAAPVHADPVPPPARPQPPICIYPNAGPGEDACETFQDDASEYCGGDPVNNSDPMGTRILVANDSWDAFNTWVSTNLSPALAGKFTGGVPTGAEGAYYTLGSVSVGGFDWPWPVTRSKYSQLQPNGQKIDASNLTGFDMFFAQALTSDQVYIFDGKSFRGATDADSGTYVSQAEVATHNGVGWAKRQIGNALAWTGDKAEELTPTFITLDMATQGAPPALHAIADIPYAAAKLGSELRAFRVINYLGELASTLPDLKFAPKLAGAAGGEFDGAMMMVGQAGSGPSRGAILDFVTEKLTPLTSKILGQFPDAKFGIRGLLGTGTRFDKVTKTATKLFSANSFDVDAYVISDKLASKFPAGETWRDIQDIKGVLSPDELQAVHSAFQQAYRGYAVHAKGFTFRVFTTTEALNLGRMGLQFGE